MRNDDGRKEDVMDDDNAHRGCRRRGVLVAPWTRARPLEPCLSRRAARSRSARLASRLRQRAPRRRQLRPPLSGRLDAQGGSGLCLPRLYRNKTIGFLQGFVSVKRLAPLSCSASTCANSMAVAWSEV